MNLEIEKQQIDLKLSLTKTKGSSSSRWTYGRKLYNRLWCRKVLEARRILKSHLCSSMSVAQVFFTGAKVSQCWKISRNVIYIKCMVEQLLQVQSSEQTPSVPSSFKAGARRSNILPISSANCHPINQTLYMGGKLLLGHPASKILFT